MKDYDFDDFESMHDDEFDLKESTSKTKYSTVRRRLEVLLENKRLQNELDEYYEPSFSRKSYDNDDMQYD